MNKKTLLELAQETKVREIKQFNFTQEDEDLVLAWCNSEVSLSQVVKVKKFTNYSQVYTYFAFVCRQIIGRNGKNK